MSNFRCPKRRILLVLHENDIWIPRSESGLSRYYPFPYPMFSLLNTFKLTSEMFKPGTFPSSMLNPSSTFVGFYHSKRNTWKLSDPVCTDHFFLLYYRNFTRVYVVSGDFENLKFWKEPVEICLIDRPGIGLSSS